MRALLDLCLHPFTREEICEGVKWILRFAGACYLQAALIKFLQSDTTGGCILLGVAAVFFAVAAIKFYFVLLLAIIGWTGFLAFDYVQRYNPFSVIFAVIGLFHIYKMIRWRTGRAEDIR